MSINIRNLELGEAVELGGATRLADDGEVLISVTDEDESAAMAMVLQSEEAVEIGKNIAKAGWRGRASVVRTRRELKKMDDK